MKMSMCVKFQRIEEKKLIVYIMNSTMQDYIEKLAKDKH